MTETNLKLVLEVLALVRQHLEHPIGVQMTKQQIVVGVNKISAVIEDTLAETQYWSEKYRLIVQKEFEATPPQHTWVGLSDEEIKAMDAGLKSNASFYAGALWAEAKLKEKNT